MVDSIPSEEIQSRLHKLQESIAEAGFDGALLLQRVDLIYYTGSVFQGALAVPASGNPELYVWRGQGLIGNNCPWEIETIASFGRLHLALIADGFDSWKSIGFEEDVVPVSNWKRMCAKVWPNAEKVADISPIIRTQRSVKSENELETVRKSGQVLVKGFEALTDIIKPGMYEYEVQAQMEVALRRAGDQALGRTRGFNAEAAGVVACGDSVNAHSAFDGPIAQPGRNRLAPAGAGNGEILENKPILVDITAGVDGYLTDMTRTYYFGKLDKHFIAAHDFCIRIIEELAKRMVPGANPEALYMWTLEQAELLGLGEFYMNRGANKVRFVGHGVGLELDEWPVLAKRFTQPLEENMVVAIEPKVFYYHGGIGLENTVIVKPGGAEIVTPMDHGLIKLD